MKATRVSIGKHETEGTETGASLIIKQDLHSISFAGLKQHPREHIHSLPSTNDLAFGLARNPNVSIRSKLVSSKDCAASDSAA